MNPQSLLLNITQPEVSKLPLWDFPDGPVVKNLPCKAGDVGSIPGWGTKIPHALEQLSLCAATPEPTHHN